jgi:hypothetical protein
VRLVAAAQDDLPLTGDGPLDRLRLLRPRLRGEPVRLLDVTLQQRLELSLVEPEVRQLDSVVYELRQLPLELLGVPLGQLARAVVGDRERPRLRAPQARAGDDDRRPVQRPRPGVRAVAGEDDPVGIDDDRLLLPEPRPASSCSP